MKHIGSTKHIRKSQALLSLVKQKRFLEKHSCFSYVRQKIVLTNYSLGFNNGQFTSSSTVQQLNFPKKIQTVEFPKKDPNLTPTIFSWEYLSLKSEFAISRIFILKKQHGNIQRPNQWEITRLTVDIYYIPTYKIST